MNKFTALTTGGNIEAEMATPTSDDIFPPNMDKATPVPDVRATITPTQRPRRRPLKKVTTILLRTSKTNS